MNSVRHGANGNLNLRPPGKEWLKDLPADFPVQFADTIDLPAAVKCEISHVEGFRSIVGIQPSKREQTLHRDGELILRIVIQVLSAEFRVEAIEACAYRRVSREHIAGPGDGQCQIERDVVIRHVVPGSLQYSECRVTFIEMADLRIQAEFAQ